jgi:hypothetical protein
MAGAPPARRPGAPQPQSRAGPVTSGGARCTQGRTGRCSPRCCAAVPAPRACCSTSRRRAPPPLPRAASGAAPAARLTPSPVLPDPCAAQRPAPPAGAAPRLALRALPATRAERRPPRPQVVERARKEWCAKHAALLPRAQFCAGDFFEPGAPGAPRGSRTVARTKVLQARDEGARAGLLQACGRAAGTIPPGRDGDAYVFRLIFHDWDDESTVKILRAVLHAAGGKRVTLLIVEVVAPIRPACSQGLPAEPVGSELGGAHARRRCSPASSRTPCSSAACRTSTCLSRSTRRSARRRSGPRSWRRAAGARRAWSARAVRSRW